MGQVGKFLNAGVANVTARPLIWKGGLFVCAIALLLWILWQSNKPVHFDFIKGPRLAFGSEAHYSKAKGLYSRFKTETYWWKASYDQVFAKADKELSTGGFTRANDPKRKPQFRSVMWQSPAGMQVFLFQAGRGELLEEKWDPDYVTVELKFPVHESLWSRFQDFFHR